MLCRTSLFKPRQLCWAGFICDAHVRLCVCLCVCVCVSVCVAVNKISQKVFNQSTSFLVGAFPLTQG